MLARQAGMESAGPPALGFEGLLLQLSDEVLLLVLRLLDPVSLGRAGGACRALHRISSTGSLWRAHCRAFFGLDIKTSCANCTAKDAFRLLYMWKMLYKTLPYNRPLQDLFFSGAPLCKYWMQWLVLEKMVPLPPIQLPDYVIEDIWGIRKNALEEKHKVPEESSVASVYLYNWKDLYHMTVRCHGSYSNVQGYVLSKMSMECHEELVCLYSEYSRFRFQWLFSYWLFGLSKSCARQLQRIFLWWKRFNKRKVSFWGTSACDIQYLASLHRITEEYWHGRLASGDENLAWILGRDWGRLKQRKVYEDTLEGVFRLLKEELQVLVVDHDKFWQVAKVQMARVCKLHESAGSYVNWKLIDVLPCYRLYMESGDPAHLEQVKAFLSRKKMIQIWILQEENAWMRHLLPEDLFHLLEFDTKIYEEKLHGDTMAAHLSRIIWIYLHSGQQLYMEAMKGFVAECAYASFLSQIYETSTIIL
ncbi:uncharacterized protein LOC115088294 isoform X2 [Rhinatrema bivittatum]|uniref:uncharacterized protein LOC115088294 isoform X2 n=1 Tax=Rhinatrema bivittatum TaxID=194408 RepID=UPI0011281299|nr:uncharacterized protein LOC115088294 isoform X2 [Rhinatrema bivittatum]